MCTSGDKRGVCTQKESVVSARWKELCAWAVASIKPTSLQLVVGDRTCFVGSLDNRSKRDAEHICIPRVPEICSGPYRDIGSSFPLADAVLVVQEAISADVRLFGNMAASGQPSGGLMVEFGDNWRRGDFRAHRDLRGALYFCFKMWPISSAKSTKNVKLGMHGPVPLVYFGSSRSSLFHFGFFSFCPSTIQTVTVEE